MVRQRSEGKPVVAFYGDDFTGASENMAQFHRHGLTSFMFLSCPKPARFAEIAQAYDAVGIAGVARSLRPDQMAAELIPVFRLFATTGTRIVQYKLCSTFDSSPSRGSLATALDIGRGVLGPCFVPIFAAMPEFGRYTAFGNHFAKFRQDVHRLDRHPSMSRHPATPMHEADLRLILEEQGCERVGLVDWTRLAGGSASALAATTEQRRTGSAPIVFDGMCDDDCVHVAELICRVAEDERVFVLAAQGFAHGLGRYLNKRAASAKPPVESLPGVRPLLVLSGSCSPITGAQLARFEQAGAYLVRLPASRLLDPQTAARTIDQVLQSASQMLAVGRSVCVFTARGPDDRETPQLLEASRLADVDTGAVSRLVGEALGAIAEQLMTRHALGRIAFAGGDTSSFALQSLNPEGLAVSSGDYATGAHVFKITGSGPADGREVILKGGQVGSDDIFVELRDGRSSTS
jgi:uncharacterized protein YgbK (DUF1537 family)